MSDDVKRLVSIPEAREKWLGGLGHTTTYSLIGSGDLVKVNIGRRSFITVESLEAYLQRLAGQPDDQTDDQPDPDVVHSGHLPRNVDRPRPPA